MSSRTRYALVVLSALGLAASLAALYVHYRLVTEPGYTSFCDVNESVSCQALYQSEYGSLFGVPVAAGGAIWAGLVLILHGSSILARAGAPGRLGVLLVESVTGLTMVRIADGKLTESWVKNDMTALMAQLGAA